MNHLTTHQANDFLSFSVVSGEEDIPELISLAREAHHGSRFSYIPFSAEKVKKIAILAIRDTKKHGVFIARRGELPVGFIYCTLGEYHIGSDLRIATIHNINVSSSVRRRLSGGKVALGLFNGAKTWALTRGAAEILFHVTSGEHLERTHRLAKRLGYITIGGSYALPLNNRYGEV